MTTVRIGLSRWNGKLANYAKRFSVVEVNGNELPPPAVLRKWRRQVPATFTFSVVLPRAVAEFLPGKSTDDALEKSLEAARALGARALVLATPPNVRPTKANVERLLALSKRLASEGPLLGWEPSGLWSREEIAAVVAASSWIPIVDAAEHDVPEGRVVYTRLRAIGRATSLGTHRLQRVAEQLLDRDEVFVVADPAIGGRLVAGLEAAMAGLGGEQAVPQVFRPAPDLDVDGLEDDEFDDEDEDEFDDEDEE